MTCHCCHPYACSCRPSGSVFRAHTAAEWAIANPTLRLGEAGFESDTGSLKIGDGVHTWTDIAYFDASGPQGPQGLTGPAGPAVAPTLRIGLVTTGPVASATITGSSPSYVLNLVLPAGTATTPGVAFSLHPSSKSVMEGETVTFNANAQSNSPVTYQWKSSTDGTAWTNVGTGGSSYSFTAAKAQDGLHIKVTATSADGTADSLVAILNVGDAFDSNLGPPTLVRVFVTSQGYQGPAVILGWGWSGHAGVWMTPPTPLAGTTLTGRYAVEAKTSTGTITTIKCYPASINSSLQASTGAVPSEFNGAVLDGYTIGSLQSFRVAAIGSKGQGAWSAWSNQITPTA